MPSQGCLVFPVLDMASFTITITKCHIKVKRRRRPAVPPTRSQLRLQRQAEVMPGLNWLPLAHLSPRQQQAQAAQRLALFAGVNVSEPLTETDVLAHVM
jgi:hypothetical protein